LLGSIRKRRARSRIGAHDPVFQPNAESSVRLFGPVISAGHLRDLHALTGDQLVQEPSGRAQGIIARGGVQDRKAGNTQQDGIAIGSVPAHLDLTDVFVLLATDDPVPAGRVIGPKGLLRESKDMHRGVFLHQV
jgi:hypothetical protein